MLSVAITTVLEVRAAANEWLMSHLPDRFAAGIPEYDDGLASWRIPVWLAYPELEPLGSIGELIVDDGGTVRAHTPIDEMKERATELYQQHREQIEAHHAQADVDRTPRSLAASNSPTSPVTPNGLPVSS